MTSNAPFSKNRESDFDWEVRPVSVDLKQYVYQQTSCLDIFKSYFLKNLMEKFQECKPIINAVLIICSFKYNSTGKLRLCGINILFCNFK